MKFEEINIENLKSNNLFDVPDGYFENFNARLFNKIENSTQPVIKFKYRKLIYTISIAASVVIIFFLSKNLLFNDVNNTKFANNTIQTTNEVELSFIDEKNIIDELSSENKSVELKGDDIINYLVDNEIDEKTIADAY